MMAGIRLIVKVNNRTLTRNNIDHIKKEVGNRVLMGLEETMKTIHDTVQESGSPVIHEQTGNLRSSWYALFKPYHKVVTDVKNNNPHFMDTPLDRNGRPMFKFTHTASQLHADHMAATESGKSRANLHTDWITIVYGYSAEYAAAANSYDGAAEFTRPGSGPGWWDNAISDAETSAVRNIIEKIKEAPLI
jgi:hypothetical protein